MAEKLTTEQRFREFADNAGGMTLAVVRATMVSNANQMLENADRIKETYGYSPFSPDLLLESARQVIKYFGFEGDGNG